MIVVIYTKVLPDYTPKWSVWVAGYFAYGLGLGLGIGGSYWQRFGIVMLSVAVGLLFSLTADILVLDKMIQNHAEACCVALLICALISIGLTLFVSDLIVTIASSMCGAFLVLRVSVHF